MCKQRRGRKSIRNDADSLEQDLVVRVADVPESIREGATLVISPLGTRTQGRSIREGTSTSIIWVFVKTSDLKGFDCFWERRGKYLFKCPTLWHHLQ